MKKEKLPRNRGTKLRKNGEHPLTIDISKKDFNHIFLINEKDFLTKNVSKEDLVIEPYHHYMVINKGTQLLTLQYSQDISAHQVVWDPYKYEKSEKEPFHEELFLEEYDIPEDYVDTLPKWYSFKFTYPEYNLIFIRPELGISFQVHEERSEHWEILKGQPIILNGHSVHYHVADGTSFEISPQQYHTVINPHSDEFVLLKEEWGGHFDEEDITRVFNPNHYS